MHRHELIRRDRALSRAKAVRWRCPGSSRHGESKGIKALFTFDLIHGAARDLQHHVLFKNVARPQSSRVFATMARVNSDDNISPTLPLLEVTWQAEIFSGPGKYKSATSRCMARWVLG